MESWDVGTVNWVLLGLVLAALVVSVDVLLVGVGPGGGFALYDAFGR